MAMDPQTKALHDCKRILGKLDPDEAEAVVVMLNARFGILRKHREPEATGATE